MKNAYTALDGRTVPDEGALMIPLTLDFTNETLFILDLSELTKRAKISGIQTIVVDNLDSQSVSLVAEITRSNQRIRFAGTQQLTIAHAECPNPCSISFHRADNATGGIYRVFLCNFPILNGFFYGQ